MKTARITLVSCLAFLFFCNSIVAASTIYDYSIYGIDNVVVGYDSHVYTGLVGSDTQVQLNGASTVDDDIHSGGGIKCFGNNITNGNLYSAGLLDIGGSGELIRGNVNAGSIDFTGGGTGAVTVYGNITYATTFTGQANGIYYGTITQGVPVSPDLPIFPTATTFSAGGVNKTNPGVLQPGTYGEVSQGSGTLVLSAGTYYMNSLTVNNSGQITLDTTGGDIRLYIVGNVLLGPNKEANVLGDGWVFAETHTTDQTGGWYHQGGGSWQGTIFAPYGGIHIGSGSSTFDYEGYMWGQNVDIEHSVTISIPEPATLVLIGLGAFLTLRKR